MIWKNVCSYCKRRADEKGKPYGQPLTLQDEKKLEKEPNVSINYICCVKCHPDIMREQEK